MMDLNNGYLSNMNDVENFPVQSFYQILLDTPRLKTS